MTFVLAACAGIVVAEVIARLAGTGIAARMGRASRHAFATMQRRGVSDHWKERVLLYSAGVIFVDTLRLALGFALAAGAVGVLALLARGLEIDLLRFLVEPVGLVFVTAVATAYVFLRRRLVR